MTVKITRIEVTKKRTVLKVDGKLLNGDADLLEHAFDLLEKKESVEIDMSGITFIDSDSASAIRRLERKGAKLTKVNFFIKTIIESTTNGNR